MLYDEDNVMISEELVVDKLLSPTGVSPGSCSYERLVLNLSSQSVDDISALSRFISLQTVDLSSNRIRSLRALSSLEQLRCLDASRNRLTEFPDFTDGADEDAFPRLLTKVDLSFNQIATIRDDIGRLRYINALNVRGNSLKTLRWCRSLINLQTLNVSDNEILDLEGLEGAGLLTDLNVSNNSITSLMVAAPISTLRYLNASGNRIDQVNEISAYFPSIAVLDLSDNAIASLLGLTGIPNLQLLRELNLTGNDVARTDQYRNELVFLLPDLECLDHNRLTTLEILQTEISHGKHRNVFPPALSAQCAVLPAEGP